AGDQGGDGVDVDGAQLAALGDEVAFLVDQQGALGAGQPQELGQQLVDLVDVVLVEEQPVVPEPLVGRHLLGWRGHAWPQAWFCSRKKTTPATAAARTTVRVTMRAMPERPLAGAAAAGAAAVGAGAGRLPAGAGAGLAAGAGPRRVAVAGAAA